MLNQLFTEILTEIPKLEDEDYDCCIVVHPEDIQDVLDFICKNTAKYFDADVIVNHKHNYIWMEGKIHIVTTKSEDWHMREHAGMQYATILIDMSAFGKFVESKDEGYPVFEPVGVTKFEDSIPYMVSRIRTNSKYKPRMVIC